jgi:hypothetical protein
MEVAALGADWQPLVSPNKQQQSRHPIASCDVDRFSSDKGVEIALITGGYAASLSRRCSASRFCFRSFFLQRLILGDGEAATFAARSLRAVRAQWAGAAGFGVEMDRRAGLEMLYLSCGAGDGFS